MESLRSSLIENSFSIIFAIRQYDKLFDGYITNLISSGNGKFRLPISILALYYYNKLHIYEFKMTIQKYTDNVVSKTKILPENTFVKENAEIY